MDGCLLRRSPLPPHGCLNAGVADTDELRQLGYECTAPRRLALDEPFSFGDARLCVYIPRLPARVVQHGFKHH